MEKFAYLGFYTPSFLFLQVQNSFPIVSYAPNLPHSPTLRQTLLHYTPNLLQPTLYSPSLFNILLHYATLFYTSPHSPALRHTPLQYSILSNTTPHIVRHKSPTLHRTPLHYAKLSYTSPSSYTIHKVLLHYSTSQKPYTTPHSLTTTTTCAYSLKLVSLTLELHNSPKKFSQKYCPEATTGTILLNSKCLLNRQKLEKQAN